VTPDPDFLQSLKKAAAALRDAGIPFLLGGGLAIWAHGGNESDHDIDFMIKPADAQRALDALVAAGMRAERPPEHWLLKVYDGEMLIDLIFAPAGLPVDDTLLGRAEMLEVKAMHMLVMRPDDVLVTKLMAMTEHSLNYESCLEISRALREQIDWDYVREHTADSPFARAYFELVEGLAITRSEDAVGQEHAERRSAIRPVLDPGATVVDRREAGHERQPDPGTRRRSQHVRAAVEELEDRAL
jgi:hypothetical protein